MSIAYGGVAPKTIMATRTAAAIQGHALDEHTLHSALEAVAEDVNIAPNAPGKLRSMCSFDTSTAYTLYISTLGYSSHSTASTAMAAIQGHVLHCATPHLCNHIILGEFELNLPQLTSQLFRNRYAHCKLMQCCLPSEVTADASIH